MAHIKFFRALAIIFSWPVLWVVWFEPSLSDAGVAFTQYCAGASLGLWLIVVLCAIVTAWTEKA